MGEVTSSSGSKGGGHRLLRRAIRSGPDAAPSRTIMEPDLKLSSATLPCSSLAAGAVDTRRMRCWFGRLLARLVTKPEYSDVSVRVTSPLLVMLMESTPDAGQGLVGVGGACHPSRRR